MAGRPAVEYFRRGLILQILQSVSFSEVRIRMNYVSPHYDEQEFSY